MSNEIEYFPRGSSTTTKGDLSSEKLRVNRVDRDDLFLGTSSKRKRSQQDSQKLQSEQKKKKKKSIEGEDQQETLYRRLHKQVRRSIFIFIKTLLSFLESHRWCSDLWLY